MVVKLILEEHENALEGTCGFALLDVDLIPFAMQYCAMFQYRMNFLQLQYYHVVGLSLLHFFPKSYQSYKFHCSLSKQSIHTLCCYKVLPVTQQ